MEKEILSSILSRYFYIESITESTERGKPLTRFTGRFTTQDTEEAHNYYMESLEPAGLTPLFRLEDKQPVIYVIQGIPEGKPGKVWLNILLAVLTFFSVLLSGSLYTLGSEPVSGENLFRTVLSGIWKGWPFAVSLLAILASHEFGHYFAGRYHKTKVTLPFFIPFPFSTFGTLGAFIQMKSVPRNRNHLLDIGIAGPLAGLVVAIPVLILGLTLSKVDLIPSTIAPGTGFQIEGNSIVYLFLKYLVKGQLLPSPVDFQNLPPFLYWIRYFFTGSPFPFGGTDVMLHPVAWAGWAGLLVTALNLLPAGQLDGGHNIYVLLGRKGTLILRPLIIGMLALLGFAWNGWWLWAVLIFFLGGSSAEPLDQISPLSSKRKLLAVFMLILFVLLFTPVPLKIVGA